MAIRSFKERLDKTRLYEEEIANFAFLTKDTHEVVILGEAEGHKVYLFQSKTPNRVLMTACWQGDEPAGWEACKVLCKETPDCSFIPFVSPSCFISHQHLNDGGRNVDREWPNPSSPEGDILIRNMDRLMSLGKECMVSLQEDPHRPFAYLYSWKVPSNIKVATKEIMSDYFPLWGEGIHLPPNDGMFANYFVGQGCNMAVQLETPADGTRTLALRTACQVDCCKAILALI